MKFEDPNMGEFDVPSNVLMFDDFFTVPKKSEPSNDTVKTAGSSMNRWIGIEPPVVQVTLPGLDPLIS
ncbi:MAG: hypothetical protein ACPGQS_11965 [Bradymonadia bacterium]